MVWEEMREVFVHVAACGVRNNELGKNRSTGPVFSLAERDWKKKLTPTTQIPETRTFIVYPGLLN